MPSAQSSWFFAIPTAAWVLLSVASSPVHADAQLSGTVVEAVHEASHELRVSVEGLIATVESEQVIVNPGDITTGAHYQFDLPLGAVVTGASVELSDGRRARATAVAAEAVFSFVLEQGTGGAPDIGIVRRLPDLSSTDEVQRFEARLSSIAPGKSAIVVLRWIAPLHYRDGRLWLRIPARGRGSNLVAESVAVRWTAPRTARGLRDVRVGGAEARTSGKTARVRATAPRSADIVVEARPLFDNSQRLVVEHAVSPLSKDRGAAIMAVLAPGSLPAEARRFDQVILVLDVSRSLGTSGFAALRTISSKLLADISAHTAIGVIAFDRDVHPVSSPTADRSTVAPAVMRALPSEGGRNGSDIESALVAVNKMLERGGTDRRSASGGESPSTLVVVISDGQFPLGFDGQRAQNVFEPAALRHSRIASVLVVPDSAPLPRLDRGALADLAERTGGRLIAVRHSDASSRSARLWNELSREPHLSDVQISGEGTWAAGTRLPSTIEPGSGHWAVGWYHGKQPGIVRVAARSAGKVIHSTSRARPGSLRAAALPLALSQRGAHEIVGPAAADAQLSAEDLRMQAAHRAGIVTEETSFVLWDPRDGFARDRIALAEKWGLARYRRLAATGERPPESNRSSDSSRSQRLTVARLSARTGQLDKAIVERLIKTHLVPRARRCYELALTKSPDLAGSAVLELEMSRGEVQLARTRQVTWANAAMNDCLLEAAYATPVPAVALGDEAEQVVLVRYPLRFRRIDKRLDVSPLPSNTGAVDPTDPLDGLTP